MNSIAPILLFTYKRLNVIKETVEALKNNYLAEKSELFVFSDGPKSVNDLSEVLAVRNFLKTISGFKKVSIHFSQENKGLAKSIIEGVFTVIENYNKVIVLEDDLVTSKNFLVFMNTSLDNFEDKKEIYSIAGYTPNIPNPPDDIYFTKRASSWGWATWRDRWENIDWDVSDYEYFKKNKHQRLQFNKMGTDLCKMLDNQMNGRINSWAIRWTYHQFKLNAYSVFPTTSKVINIGTDDSATHTVDKFNRFGTTLDSSNIVNFNFNKEIKLENYYLKYFLSQYSYTTRIKYKILNWISKIFK